MKKLKVAICDDIPIVTSALENYLREYPGCNFECDCINKSEKLTEAIKTTKYDIYLLDVEMPGKNGLEVAHEIRKNDFDAYIIFITSHINYMKDVFKVHTFDYLLKPVNREKVYQVMDRIFNFIENSSDKFCYTKRNTQIIVALKDIIYFEKQGRYVMIRTKENTDKFIMSTNELLEKLNKNFIQIHTSYIINLNYLQRVSSETVILFVEHKCKEEVISLQISRKFRENVREEIVQFMGGKLGV
ncbi:response regulator transcription factor [Enterococcus saccharolyticus]|uniref:LytR/AlgR family response regulator transcription factor n=2 Tax=Enterococcus TaxID=1350 RepID=UPI001E52DB28|nr:LytTR family DNA-binding domain-containing protein [Enterococcus saccharolyticus]MCD5003689.1 response regulator transcription factor [Enterococcus saccharolyticus]